MRNVLLITVAVVVLLAVAVVASGSLMPPEYEASRTLFLPRSAREIWVTVTKWREFPKWRTGIRKARPREDRRGWIEIGAGGNQPIAIVTAVAPHDLVLEFGDEPGSDRWTFEIRPVPTGAGCNVTITERGRVEGSIARFVARVFTDERAAITTYLTELAARFREDAEFTD